MQKSTLFCKFLPMPTKICRSPGPVTLPGSAAYFPEQEYEDLRFSIFDLPCEKTGL